MANSRDFTGKNRKFTGTKGIVTPKGTTGQRVGSESGELRFNTTTELMEYYDGTTWKPIDAPPTISSVTTSDSVGTNTILIADGSSLFTITITGGNFSLGPTVKFIGSTGTEYTPGNITRVSASSITCTTLITMGTTDDPYDVRVTNTSGLSATLDDAFSYNAPPVFATASGQLGTVYDTQVISGSTFNASATDAEGNTITYSIISGALPGTGLTLSSSTGLITGTLASTPSLGNYPFVVRASTTEGVVERQFSIQVVAVPPYAIDFLVVAGGGGGGGQYLGGGGGAGGFRTSTQTPNLGVVITVTVGDGGNGNNADGNTDSTSGTASSISGSSLTTISSAGGGYGKQDQNSGPAGSGGSGGGGSGSGSPGTRVAGSGNSPSTAPSQGNDGGAGAGPDGYGGGGGGGASAVGNNGTTSVGGVGGAGTASSITGSSVTRAGGGGGSAYAAGGGSAASGGSGGGGNGGANTVGVAGAANTGGGGGGSDSRPGPNKAGNGGKGVVILSVPTSRYSSTTTGSPTVTTSGNNTIMVFNGSGSYTT